MEIRVQGVTNLNSRFLETDGPFNSVKHSLKKFIGQTSLTHVYNFCGSWISLSEYYQIC